MVQWLCFFKHDYKTGSNGTQGLEVTTISGALNAADNTKGSSRGQPTETVEEDYDDTAPGFCCWKGCITGSVAVFLFFIVFPAGILIINYSSNNDDQAVMILGIVLTVLPLIALGGIIAAIFHRRTVTKRQRQKDSESRTKP